ncbi:ATP-dependent zinc metalloprotease FtsH [uncultured Adlercreutzia sp.]|uniref:ATP-dependent zinc metalloprotease FtsH n=1 Tax=uncultured Adlercreutzia sp. TaxID=875803 RepID=UPI0025D0F278|nr:ATP-dependent zinc metalloprotease FtsH [uncultured Adlercreutzia sp.]
MADNNSKKPTPPNTTQRTTMAMVIILLAVAFFVGSQFMRTGAVGNTVTDELITSEFTQAVEQDRVQSVTYSAGDYTVSGSYFPAATAGSEIAEGMNGAFNAMNALLATKMDDAGKSLSGVATTTLDPATLGKEHNYVSTYVGSDSLGELLAAHPDISYQVTLPSPILEVVATLLPILIIGGLLFFFFFKMQQANNSQMNFGKAKTKKAAEERPDVKFSDVAGVDEAVEEMQEIKDFLANPAKYQSMGAKIPRGCLLVGPPGTGKTLLARAVAGEAGVPFFSISGSDFVEMFVGVGASRVRDLFQQAKDAAPAIIFIDEIDAVGRQRGTGLGGGHDEREQTLNQLLVEMDGFESNDSVVLIAATNRADVLDPALLRPGRFDRQIVVDTPDVKGREKILNVHAKDKPIGSDVDLNKIAKITPGFTGADLANLMNESALLTARRGKKIITMREVSESMERVIAGPERKGRVMNEKTKHTIAYHESGHALVGHLLDHADPVHKISIISRGRALGYTLSIPDEDKVLNSLSEMKDELAVFMGGRVAEEIFCDDVTTGASNDLERASKMARAIVTQYGMSPLGTQVFGQPNHEVFLGRDYGNTQDYSEETARRIDEEVAKIMKEAHDRAHKILSDHAEQMDLMASVLLERETVEGEACEALLDNKWDEYLAREDDIIAAKEAEEAAARAKDEALLAEREGNAPVEGANPDAGETLADPNWREEPVEPGDQDANGPFRAPAEDADRADMPTQEQVDAEIDREDDMDSSADAPDPDKRD